MLTVDSRFLDVGFVLSLVLKDRCRYPMLEFDSEILSIESFMNL